MAVGYLEARVIECACLLGWKLSCCFLCACLQTVEPSAGAWKLELHLPMIHAQIGLDALGNTSK